MVAAHSLMVGPVLRSAEAAGWNDWSHDGLLFAAVPVVAWTLSRWWAARS